MPLIIYFVMGWLIVLAINPLLVALPRTGFIWLLTGGLLYTSGIVFYALDRRYPWMHGVWHLFVLAGSISHYRGDSGLCMNAIQNHSAQIHLDVVIPAVVHQGDHALRRPVPSAPAPLTTAPSTVTRITCSGFSPTRLIVMW